MDVKAWLADKKRGLTGKPPTKEEFKPRSFLERMKEAGFKAMIKSDVVELRREELRQTLAYLLQVVHGFYSDEEKGLAVDMAFSLVMNVASFWLRSMDNDWLEYRMNCFDSNYREWRSMPEFYDHIVEEAVAIINKSMSNIDVEPLPPIIIWTGPPPQKRENMTSKKAFGEE